MMFIFRNPDHYYISRQTYGAAEIQSIIALRKEIQRSRQSHSSTTRANFEGPTRLQS